MESKSQTAEALPFLTIILLDTSQILGAVLGQNNLLFFLPVVQNKGQVDSPTDELVLSGEVEVAVQLQVSRPPLHPLLLDVWREK